MSESNCGEFALIKNDIMELTGKCKEDFEKWVNQNHQKLIVRMGSEKTTTGTLILWDEFPLSLKWGVYVDFFDSVGIKILIKNQDYQNWWFFHIKPVDIHETYIERSLRNTRSEARKSAIEKANEIYNNNALK